MATPSRPLAEDKKQIENLILSGIRRNFLLSFSSAPDADTQKNWPIKIDDNTFSGGASRLAPQPDTGLGDRTRAENENVHQSFGALRPIRPGGHVGNADERPEQIEWIEVRPDVATFDRSLH
jgi:hypothetical protein